jgi:serine protease Do
MNRFTKTLLTFTFLVGAATAVLASPAREAALIASKKDATVLIYSYILGHKQPDLGTGMFTTVLNKDEIITNQHVIDGAFKITVRQEGSTEEYPATVEFSDKYIDMAVIKIDSFEHFLEDNKPSYFDLSETPVYQVQDVYVIGHPWGLNYSISKGIVSKEMMHLTANPGYFIQTDAHVYAGNSGGPLLNEDGEVVGMNTFMVAKQAGGSYGEALAAPAILKTLKDWKAYGEARWPKIGYAINTDNMTIAGVEVDSPAEKAGLKVGDIVTHLGHQRLHTTDELLSQVNLLDYHDAFALTVKRQGQTVAIVVNPTYLTSQEALASLAGRTGAGP